MNSWMLLGGGAAAGIIASCWSHVRSMWSYFISFAIVTFESHGTVSEAVLCYCSDKAKHSKYGPRSFIGWLMYVRPNRRIEAVALETLGTKARLAFIGWKPIWITRISETGSQNDTTGIAYRPVQLSFVRGLFDVDLFIEEAMRLYNSKPHFSSNKRHRVVHVSGTAGKKIFSNAQEIKTQSPHSVSDLRQYRIVSYSPDELGPWIPKRKAIDFLAMTDEMESFVSEIRSWSQQELWFRDRDIPWRMGSLLHGPPGCGKTAMVRAIAEMLDYPIYSFDLATLYNDELRREWSEMLSETPCIALFEDFDAVFDGRETLCDVTFDCVLNCLDGVERVDGLLTFITTNVSERIDGAIAQAGSDGEMCSRPGRIDRCIRLGELTEAGRWKIASRILSDVSDSLAEIVSKGDGDTGAQFQERCVRSAMSIKMEPTKMEPTNRVTSNWVLGSGGPAEL